MLHPARFIRNNLHHCNKLFLHIPIVSHSVLAQQFPAHNNFAHFLSHMIFRGKTIWTSPNLKSVLRSYHLCLLHQFIWLTYKISLSFSLNHISLHSFFAYQLSYYSFNRFLQSLLPWLISIFTYCDLRERNKKICPIPLFPYLIFMGSIYYSLVYIYTIP